MEIFAIPAVYYIILRNSPHLPSGLEFIKLSNNLSFTTFMYLCFSWWKTWNNI